MSAAMHTPGPWRWSNEFQTSEGNETWSLLGSDGFGILSCDGAPNSPQNVNPHDADLIAAAPTLLEVLREIHDSAPVCWWNLPIETQQRVKAAIAKAAGGAS